MARRIASAPWMRLSAGVLGGSALALTIPSQASSETKPTPPQPRMFVRDPEVFAKKWKKFATDGVDKLLVIADFDYTLTPTLTSEGEPSPSTHGVLLRTPALDPAVHEIGEQLFEKYYPIEQSNTLTFEEKLPGIEAWWTAKHNALVEYKLTKQLVVSAVRDCDAGLRPGFMAVFDALADDKVPTLIFSAGLYDVIHAILDKEYAKTPRKTLPSNVHVIANMVRFDEDGKAVGFDGKLIHSLNKTARVVTDTPFWKQCQLENRRNLVLLGDSLTDAGMSDGLELPEDQILRVGFLNDRVTDERLELYMAKFDVVLTNDCSMAPVELLVHQIKTSTKSE